ncbi:ABC transporter permease [Streptomyces sp. 4N509B]|uniref:ABC transporter permease n=1 Tax=Streptomyces sp. 4N509B TaxID=3457413 RepID=UPI003FD2B26F
MSAAATSEGPAGRTPRRGLALVAHQIRYEQLTFWRNPQSAFFTFVFPVVVVTVFGAVMDGDSRSDYFFGLTALQYYVGTIAALSVLGACYSQLAIVLSGRRQSGILKRVRATPLPAGAYVAGLLAHCVMVSLVDVALILGVGRLYGVPLPDAAQLPALVVTLVTGAASFCSLGVGVAALVRNAEAAPAVVQFVLFPLVFVSGTYLPIHSEVLNGVADVLPVRPFNEALLAALARDAGPAWRELAVLALWGGVGALVAARFFRWDPRPE